jgi:hypothetical protein
MGLGDTATASQQAAPRLEVPDELAPEAKTIGKQRSQTE